MTNTQQPGGGGRALTLAFLTAMIEGFDLQSAGVAAPRLAPAFGLTPHQMGFFFSAATLGLIFGAVAGGFIADRFGRRTGLVISLAMFSLFSFGTASVGSIDMLIVMRFLTGVGLGGALPNLVAIASEAARPDQRGRAVSIMYAGMPIGGAVVSALAMVGFGGDWRMIFIAGGLLPLLMITPLHFLLPPLRVAPHESALGRGRWKRLFAPGSMVTTVLLWLGFFFGLVVVYLLLNWLPALLVSRGFSRPEASLVQIAFNLGGALGSVVGGLLLDNRHRVLSITGWSLLVVASLILLGIIPAQIGVTVAVGAAVGASIFGAQAIFYGVAPQCYPADVRGAGVGVAVAMGRLGSIVGPLLAGGLVSAGRGPTDVLMALVPISIISSAACVALVVRRNAAGAPAAAAINAI